MKKIVYLFSFLSQWACVGKPVPTSLNVLNQWAYAPDSLPVTLAEMKIVHPPFFKRFTGKVGDRNLTLLVKKAAKASSTLYKGFYYFQEDGIIRAAEGYETVYGGYNAVTAHHISSLEGEKREKSKSDMGYSYVTFGNFAGWFKGNEYVGYLADSSFRKGCNVPKLLDMDTTLPKQFIHLTESQSQYEYVGQRIIVPHEVDKTRCNIVIDMTLSLPKDSSFQAALLNVVFGFRTIDSASTVHYVVRQIRSDSKISNRVDGAIRRRIPYPIAPSLNLVYADSNVASFAYECRELHKNALLTYDLKKKHFIKSDVIFKKNHFDQVKDIVLNTSTIQAILNDRYKSDGFDPTQCEQYCLTNKGIVFQFPPTEIVLNCTYVFVPYADIQNGLSDEVKNLIKNW